MPETRLIIFNQQAIRRTFYNDEWWFAVGVLTDSVDIKQYVKRMRSRDKELNRNWGTICTPLRLEAADGKQRAVTCANTEGLLRIIQSIPSSNTQTAEGYHPGGSYPEFPDNCR